MPFSKKSKRAARVVRVKRPDGTVKEYRYPAYKARPTVRASGDSIQALVAAWQHSPAWTDLAESSRNTYRIYLRVLEDLGATPVTEITRRHLLAIQDRLAVRRGPGAANMFIRTAGSLFNWAVDRGWVERSPVHRIPMRPGGSLLTWTPEQVSLALAGLPEHLRRVVVLGAYTGQRRGDLCAMTWAAYDGESLQVTQKKTGTSLVIAAHPALRRELDQWQAQATSSVILTNSRGRPWDADTLTNTLRIALDKLGLPRLNVHGLRSMFASELASRGASVHMIQAGTGHKTLGMVAHYTRAADQRRLNQDAISLLPDLSLQNLTNPEKTETGATKG